jgi:hypothetical protein
MTDQVKNENSEKGKFNFSSYISVISFIWIILCFFIRLFKTHFIIEWNILNELVLRFRMCFGFVILFGLILFFIQVSINLFDLLEKHFNNKKVNISNIDKIIVNTLKSSYLFFILFLSYYLFFYAFYEKSKIFTDNPYNDLSRNLFPFFIPFTLIFLLISYVIPVAFFYFKERRRDLKSMNQKNKKSVASVPTKEDHS